MIILVSVVFGRYLIIVTFQNMNILVYRSSHNKLTLFVIGFIPNTNFVNQYKSRKAEKCMKTYATLL